MIGFRSNFQERFLLSICGSCPNFNRLLEQILAFSPNIGNLLNSKIFKSLEAVKVLIFGLSDPKIRKIRVISIEFGKKATLVPPPSKTYDIEIYIIHFFKVNQKVGLIGQVKKVGDSYLHTNYLI